MKERNIRAKKSLGQNFLKDKNILNKIVTASGIDKNTDVIEIGPGTGNLTNMLAAAARRVLAYEIDKELMPMLSEKLKKYDNVVVLHKDILDANTDEDINTFFPDTKEVIVVANLPYYITTPILRKFLEEKTKVARLIVMMQLEVAKRISSLPGNKNYGALSVSISYRAAADLLFKVPASAFVPMPKVDSAVVRLSIREKPLFTVTNEDYFFDFVHKAFAYRRKTLANCLLVEYPEASRENIETMIKQAGVDPLARAETIEADNFGRLSNIFWGVFGEKTIK